VPQGRNDLGELDQAVRLFLAVLRPSSSSMLAVQPITSHPRSVRMAGRICPAGELLKSTTTLEVAFFQLLPVDGAEESFPVIIENLGSSLMLPGSLWWRGGSFSL